MAHTSSSSAECWPHDLPITPLKHSNLAAQTIQEIATRQITPCLPYPHLSLNPWSGNSLY